MVQFDGENKDIILSGSNTFYLSEIYSLARAWESQEGTIIFHNPFDVSTELLFTLRYGWKFKPSGYSANSIVKVIGKLSTTEGDNQTVTVPPTTGQPVTWQFDTPATAIIVTVASETVNVWNEPPTAQEISNQVVADIGEIEVSGLTEEQNEQLMKTLREDTFIALK